MLRSRITRYSQDAPIPHPGPSLTARHATLVLAGILLLTAAGSILASVERPFWYDEIITVTVARLPDMPSIWNALANGVDGSPALFYAIEHTFGPWIADPHIGYRLPSTLGFLATIAGVYLILARRLDRLSALTGAASLLATNMAAYAYEARSYTLWTAALTGAIACWQRIDEGWRYCLGLALAIACAFSLHYYTAYVLLAFAATEAYIYWRQRRIRIPVLVSLAAGCIPLLFYRPMMAALRAQGAHFWAQPRVFQIATIPLALLNAFRLESFAFYFVLLIMIFDTWWTKPRPADPSGVLPPAERFLALMLLSLPLYGIVAAYITHGGMTARYLMPFLLGAAIAVGWRARLSTPMIQWIVLASAVLSFVLSLSAPIYAAASGTLLARQTAATEEIAQLAAKAPEPGLPVVVSTGIRYLEMDFYTPPAPEIRPMYILDREEAVRWTNTDTSELNLEILSHYKQLSLEPFSEFRRAHRDFILIDGPGQEDDDMFYHWWAKKLHHDGYRLTTIYSESHTNLYLVSAPPAKTANPHPTGARH